MVKGWAQRLPQRWRVIIAAASVALMLYAAVWFWQAEMDRRYSRRVLPRALVGRIGRDMEAVGSYEYVLGEWGGLGRDLGVIPLPMKSPQRDIPKGYEWCLCIAPIDPSQAERAGFYIYVAGQHSVAVIRDPDAAAADGGRTISAFHEAVRGLWSAWTVRDSAALAERSSALGATEVFTGVDADGTPYRFTGDQLLEMSRHLSSLMSVAFSGGSSGDTQ